MEVAFCEYDFVYRHIVFPQKPSAPLEIFPAYGTTDMMSALAFLRDYILVDWHNKPSL